MMPDSKQEYLNSVIFGFKNFSRIEKVFYVILFFLVPFQPLIAWWTKPQIKGRRRNAFFSISTVVVLSLLGLFFSDYCVLAFPDKFHQSISSNIWIKIAAVVSGVLLVNFVCYIIYLIFDIHNILADAFRNSTKKQLDECFEEILGHKLWSGKKTYKFLDFLLKENMNLGRAKWLLVNFLRDAIENSIQKEEVNITNGVDEKTQVLPQYKIEGNKWNVYDYSLFLKNNLAHAEKSVHWLVDPKDFLCELIPSYLTEVIVSIGMSLNPKSWASFKPLLRESKSPCYCIHEVLREIGIDYSSCPWNIGAKCSHLPPQKNQCDGNDCASRGLKWDKETDSQKSLFNCFFAIYFNLGLEALTRTVKTTNKTITIGSETIKFDKIRKEYQEREDFIDDYSLPHIFEFKNLLVEHKRHIYLGIDGDVLRNIVKEDLKVSSSKDYCQMVYPKIRMGEGEPPIIEQDGCFISGKADPSIINKYEGLWEATSDQNVFDILLQWSYRLFEFSSGGENDVRGVIVKDKPGRKIFDLGVYDARLLINSIPANNNNSRIRKIDWTLYNNYSPDISNIMTTYFLTKKNLLYSYQVQEKLIQAFLKEKDKPNGNEQ